MTKLFKRIGRFFRNAFDLDIRATQNFWIGFALCLAIASVLINIIALFRE